MNRLFCFLCIVFGAAWLSAKESGNAEFLLPAEPQGQVCDEMNWLSTEVRAHWESQLKQWKIRDQVDVFLVILPTLKGTPPDHVCKRIGDIWGDPDLHGVVLYAVDSDDGPWVWWGGRVIDELGHDPRVRKAMIARMEKRARSEMSAPERIQSAANELSDSIRLQRSQWQQTKLVHEKFNDSIYRKWTKDRVNSRMLFLVLTAAGLLGLLLLGWILLLWRKSNKVYLFPKTSSQRRFGAPYSGGSGAYVILSKSRSSS